MTRASRSTQHIGRTSGVTDALRWWRGVGPRGALLAAMLAALGAAPASASGLYQQTVVLNPGWNAIWLEVQPEPADIESAFAGVPIASVWAWIPLSTGVDFVSDPDEGLLKLQGWQGYFPRPRPEAFLSNLFRLQANRAYLVRLDSAEPVTWRVSGRPVVRRPTWVADSFNLVGFPVDPVRPPTLGAYFEGSDAHVGQPIYRLGPGGVWTPVDQPYSATIRSGEAYWVYCRGTSTYQGPLDVEVDGGTGLEYSAALSSQFLRVTNNTSIATDITLRRLGTTTTVPLSLALTEEGSSQVSWPDLPASYALPAVAGQELRLELGVRRAALAADRAEGILEISNGLGARRLVPLGANRIQPLAAGAKSTGPVSTPYAGLWLGRVEVEAVSEAQRGGTTPTTVGRTFPLRMLLHVDGSGRVRLLKEVIQMWQEGTYVPHPEDPTFVTVGTPGRHVLVTDDDLIPSFTGVAMRDGQPVGVRLSTVAYDFPGETVDVAGTFSPTGLLSVTLATDSSAPTNPFLHRYHPDHDNLDAQFLSFEPEAYAFTRRIELIFSDVHPTSDNPPPDWGDSLLGGVFTERISGIHRRTIFVRGSFELRRVSAVPVLNE